MKATLTLNLEIGFYEGQSMTMQVLSNSEEVVPTRTFSDAKTPITFDLNLPTKLDIILDNRLDSDVRTDAQGNIIENKYIHLKRMDFNFLEIDDWRLTNDLDVLSYADVNGKSIDNTTFWNKNGTVSINFSDSDPALWMLKHDELW
jgi:hypothetical protein|tara:strand:+ start:242 stop:679 length:438 start_codon:yes stop_codon:yes gene_type:complete